MKKNILTIATRESPLALWQAHQIKAELEKQHSHLNIHLLGLTTTADKMLNMPLYKAGGKGLFVKELEEALLDGRADIAVHSMKDVPMDLPESLCVPVMCEREEVRDVFVSNHYASWQALPPHAKVGTSSLRRQSQLLALRPDLNIVALRGNVNTRLAKLDKGEFSAIILAGAGLKRLGYAERIQYIFAVEEMLPAAGQGVLGIECRKDDAVTQALIAPLMHSTTYQCVTAERALCRKLGGGCHVPIAAYATMEEEKMILRGLVASPDGKTLLRVQQQESSLHAEKLGIAVAESLLQQGADKIL